MTQAHCLKYRNVKNLLFWSFGFFFKLHFHILVEVTSTDWMAVTLPLVLIPKS